MACQCRSFDLFANSLLFPLPPLRVSSSPSAIGFFPTPFQICPATLLPLFFLRSKKLYSLVLALNPLISKVRNFSVCIFLGFGDSPPPTFSLPLCELLVHTFPLRCWFFSCFFPRSPSHSSSSFFFAPPPPFLRLPLFVAPPVGVSAGPQHLSFLFLQHLVPSPPVMAFSLQLP